MHIIWIIWRLTDTFSCWSPVCLATGIVDAVWWESWACWLVPGGQSCLPWSCFQLCSPLVLPALVSFLVLTAEHSAHECGTRLLFLLFPLGLVFCQLGGLWSQVSTCSVTKKYVFLAQVIPALLAEIQNTLSIPRAVGNPSDLAGSCWLPGGRSSLMQFHTWSSTWNSWSSFWHPKCAYFLLVMAFVLMGWESAFGCRWRANCCPGVMWSLLPAGVSIP